MSNLPKWTTRRAPPRWRPIVPEHAEQRHPLALAVAAVMLLFAAVTVAVSVYALHLHQASPPAQTWTHR